MAKKTVRYDTVGGAFSYRDASTDVTINPGGSGNATSIRSIPVSTATPSDGNALTYDADKEELSWASGSGGVPEAPNDGKLYARKSAGWVEADASAVGADTSGAASTVGTVAARNVQARVWLGAYL